MFFHNLTLCSYPKVAISKHFTVNQAQTLIEAQSLIYPLKRHFWVGAVVRSVFFFRLDFHSFVRISFSVGKDILFCNFWLKHWLVRIANVYGFQCWHINSTLYFSICLSQFSSLLSISSYGFCIIIGTYSALFISKRLTKYSQ